MGKKKSNKKESKKKKPLVKQKEKSNSFWKQPKFLGIAFGILLISFIAFFPALDAGTVNWDDDRNFYENDMVTSINQHNFWSNTKEIFKSNVIGGYNPLSIWTFALEKRLHDSPSPPWPTLEHAQSMHLTNILLHLVCVLLVFRIAMMLGLNVYGAAFVALLFGIHPMRVESVAWITERKDVLYGAFFLGAMYYYIKFLDSGRKMKYMAIIMVLFTLSLFSKIQAVSLPLSFLAIDYIKNRPLKWSLIFEKWHLFLMSLAFGLLGVYMLRDFGTLENKVEYPIWQRLFVGSWSYLIYLVKSVVPFRMVPLYPYEPKMPVFFYPSMIIAPITLWLFWKAFKSKKKFFVFGILFFTFNIIFLLQIVGAGQGLLADRFTYIAYFGLFFIYGYVFQNLGNWFPKIKNIVLPIGALVILGYGFMSFNQCKIWKDSGTLWTHVLKYYNNITLPFGNRANFYRDSGQTQKALSDYSTVIRLKPNLPGPYNSRGRLYFNTKNNRDTLLLALADYNKAIELEPNDGEYYANRGATYARLGRNQEALNDLTKCLQIKPDHLVGYLNRSVLYNNAGDYERALSDIRSYLKLNPNNPDLWYESARAKRLLGRHQEAIPDYDRAIQGNPRAFFYYERAKTYFTVGNLTKARQDFQIAKQNGARIEPGIEQQIMGQ